MGRGVDRRDRNRAGRRMPDNNGVPSLITEVVSAVKRNRLLGSGKDGVELGRVAQAIKVEIAIRHRTDSGV